MVQTRSQEKSSGSTQQQEVKPKATSKKRAEPPSKDSVEEVHSGQQTKEFEAEPPTKSAKRSNDDDKHITNKNEKINILLSDHGAFPLQDCGLANPHSPSPSTILAHVFHALLTSTRISHQLANKTLVKVVEAGYADLEKLEQSSWEERTQVLTEGGYTHYREKTATELGELAQLTREKYDGDLNNLLKKAKEGNKEGDVEAVRSDVRKGVSAIKGIGGVALDVFCDTVQAVWHELAPFVDPRSQKTAEKIGISSDAAELFKVVGEDAVTMSRLAVAFTTVRLEKLEDQYTKA
ncbi:hypothetical protein LTR37_006580 [Vermiconidia calcicola]|uniref:Uncharacterized protein n=1 Tax=Vermiconidia calcicola TaxID=1690605 RepID=A0ACC3NIL0_9PEZI|nr:hypothetical protein LTR37_006580 [Vermiconidia calcicola]